MLIPLKLVRDRPLQQQLHEQLRELILSARLTAGTRMPSTRMLAEQFAISRITVLLTYERLIAEGLLRTVPASGTFVSPIAAVAAPRRNGLKPAEPAASAGPPVGRPDPALFPSSRWRGLVRAALDRLGASLAEDHTDGDPALREAIARRLSSSRGITADPGQIILAAGRQHALNIAAHLLLCPGRRAVMEQPCDPRAEALIAGTGATLVRVPVDSGGMRTGLLPDSATALVLVTPEHQRPLGVVLEASRRAELLTWAFRAGAVVIEDDVDGEFRYDTMDAAPLISLDREGAVIHLGGFEASLGPGTALSYLVVPHRLIAPALAARRVIGDDTSRLETAALTTFLDSGGYTRHLHQLRKTYLARRDALVGSLRFHWGDHCVISGASAGLHLAWHLPPHLPAAETVAELARGAGLDAEGCGERVVLFGFGVLTERQIEQRIGRLAAALGRTRDASAQAMANAGD
jgi:GntR family transcriptional regulator/MocR family aminotransferase